MRMIVCALIVLACLSPVLAGAQTALCQTQLTDARLEVQLTDSQRARAVKDLAMANRLLNEQEATITRLKAEVAKLKQAAEKPADKSEGGNVGEAK